MRRLIGLGVFVALCVGGCSLLVNGKDLRGTGAAGDMAAGGSGGSDGGGGDMSGGGGAGGDMGGGGGAGGGGSGGGGGSTGPLTLAFTKQTPVATGLGPLYMAVGDFDHDGHLDVATANYMATTVSIVFGDGTALGNEMEVSIPPAIKACAPYAIAAGRFNADAIDDLVVTCTDQDTHNSVNLIKGSASRTYSAEQLAPLTSGTDASSFEGIAAGDFNKDGKLDIAVSDYQMSNVHVLLGNGDGSFGASTASYPAGTGPVGLAVGDLDGDTRDDLVVFNYGVMQIQVLLQNTSGGFATTVPYTTPGYTANGALADVNHDGKLDALGADETDDKIIAFLDSPTVAGTFKANPAGFTTHPTPEQVAIADFDHDGNLDVVTTDTITNQIDVMLGKGDGTFGAPTTVTTLPNVSGVIVGDFTGDGLPDIVVCGGPVSGGTVTLIVNSSH